MSDVIEWEREDGIRARYTIERYPCGLDCIGVYGEECIIEPDECWVGKTVAIAPKDIMVNLARAILKLAGEEEEP